MCFNYKQGEKCWEAGPSDSDKHWQAGPSDSDKHWQAGSTSHSLDQMTDSAGTSFI